MYTVDLSKSRGPGRQKQQSSVSKWQKRLYLYLGICSFVFGILTIFSITALTDIENAEIPSHSHHDDLLINIIDKVQIKHERILKDGSDKIAVKNEIDSFSLKDETNDLVLEDSVAGPNVRVPDDKKLNQDDREGNLEEEVSVQDADLSEPWPSPDNHMSQPELYKVPGEDFEGEISQNTLNKRMSLVQSAMSLSWARYRECAWGADKLHGDRCHGSTWFGIGTTIIDSLDTMFLMGMRDEVGQARQFISNMDYRKGAKNVNIFEITIRVFGALLTMFNFTKDRIYLTKAVELGDLILDSKAFDTYSGIPLSDIDLSTGKSHKPTCPGCKDQSSLSEVTTIQIEFNELTRLTGDKKYKAASDRAMETILNQLPYHHLPSIYVDVKSGKSSGALTLGARGDSFYEYLLKQWIQTQDTKYKDAYLAAVDSIKQKLVFSSKRNLTYVAELINNKISHKMDHLVCFLPGSLALGTEYGAPSWHLSLAEQIIRTCVEMYHTKSGLAPEIIKFDKNSQLVISPKDAFSILRPETVESLFILWRVTHKPKYRQWAWDIFSAIERSAKHQTNGFSSMTNIDSDNPQRKGEVESFFFAETLKYLYLINSPDDVIPLDRYVFNTEAHPFPIRPDTFPAR